MTSSRRIISSFFVEEVVNFSFVIFIALSVLIVINQFYLIMRDSLSSIYFLSEITKIIFYKIIINSPIVILLSFFAGINLAISKLVRQSEIYIFFGAGIGRINFFQMLFLPIIKIFVIIFFLVFFLNPVLNQEIESIRVQAQKNIDRVVFHSSKFHSFNNGKLNIYIEKVEQNNQVNQIYTGLFVINKLDKEMTIIISNSGLKKNINGEMVLELHNGNKYNLDPENFNITSIQQFSKMNINLTKNQKKIKKDFIKNDDELETSELLKNISIYGSEIFWRISQSFSILFLSIIAIFSFQVNHRQTQKTNYLYSFMALIIYFNFLVILKNSIEVNILSFGSSVTLMFTLALLIIFLLFRYNSKFN